MSNCSDCGQPTLTDGVCITCSDRRFWEYQRLKNMERRLDNELQQARKAEKPFHIYNQSNANAGLVREILEKIKGISTQQIKPNVK